MSTHKINNRRSGARPRKFVAGRDSQSGLQPTTVNDGWIDIAKGYGTQADPRTNRRFCSDSPLDYEELQNIWRFDGYTRRIIEIKSETMVREWFEINIDCENLIEKKLQDLKAKSKIKKMISMANVFGGAIIVMQIDDGGLLHEPVDEENIKKILSLRVYDKGQIDDVIVDNDPASETCGQIITYMIDPRIQNIEKFPVDSSRVLRFDGEDVSDVVRFSEDNKGFGDSLIQKMRREIMNIGIAYNSVSVAMDDFNLAVLKVNNLQDLVVSGNNSNIIKRLKAVDLCKSNMKSVLIGGDEEYMRLGSVISGADSILQEFAFALSATSGVPTSILMGRQPGGLSNSNDPDTRNFYDDISNLQESKLLDPVNRLVEVIAKSKEFSFTEDEVNDIEIKFHSLWQLDETELATARKTQAETDKIYSDMGMPPEILLSHRFGTGEQSFDTNLTIEQQQLLNEAASPSRSAQQRISQTESTDDSQET